MGHKRENPTSVGTTMTSWWGHIVTFTWCLSIVVFAMIFDFLFSCWPRRKRLKKFRSMKTSKKLFPWRIDLQNASPAEYSKILEARRLELLDVLDTGNFTDSQMTEWICLMEERDRILRLSIVEVNQTELVRKFAGLFGSLKELLSLSELSAVPISLHSSLIHTWQEVRKYLTQHHVDVDQLSQNRPNLRSLTLDPHEEEPLETDKFDEESPNDLGFIAPLSAPNKASSPLKGGNLPPLKTSADICQSLDDLLSPQLHTCYTPTTTDDNLSICTSTDTFDDRQNDRRRLKIAHRRFFPASFSCHPATRVIDSAEVLQEKCRMAAATSELD